MVSNVAAKTARAGSWVQPTLSVFRQIIFQIADIDASLQRRFDVMRKYGGDLQLDVRDGRPPLLHGMAPC